VRKTNELNTSLFTATLKIEQPNLNEHTEAANKDGSATNG